MRLALEMNKFARARETVPAVMVFERSLDGSPIDVVKSVAPADLEAEQSFAQTVS